MAGHEGDQHRVHTAECHLPRQFPVLPAVHARPDAAAGERIRAGRRRDLHGVINAPRLVERVHRRGRDEAVRCQSGQRTGEDGFLP